MSDVKVQVLKNGPLLVKGAIDLLDSAGQPIVVGAQIALCRCGKSDKKPFCDGTHAKAGFEHTCSRQV